MSHQPPTPRSSDPPAAPPASPDTGQAEATGQPATTFDLKPGASPVPDYTLVERLGRGGFGEVWKASGPGGIKVAMKFVRLQEKTGAIEQRALDLIKDIRDSHLLDVYGSWQRDGMLILAMQLADKSLLQRLEECHRLDKEGVPIDELLDHMRDAARGLDYLHGHGIQHRDVKPHNLLLVGGGVRVADFGLAKVLEQTRKTHSGGMSIAYAPPEFFQGQVTSQSDQYSLAVTYCQLRGGSLPFGGNEYQLMFGHLNSEPDLGMLPEPERPVVARALAKKPEARWPSCRSFVEALTVVQAPNLPAQPFSAKPAPPREESIPPTLTDRRFRRARRRPLLLVGSLLAACLAVPIGLACWHWANPRTGSLGTQLALQQSPKEEKPQELPRDQPEPAKQSEPEPAKKAEPEPPKMSAPEPKKQPELEPLKKADPPARPSLELDCEESFAFEAGSKAVLRVGVQRMNCKGPAQVELIGLPVGVMAPPVTLPEGANVARLELTASTDVEVKADPLTVRARLENVEKTTTVRLTVTVRPSLTLLAIAPVRIEAGQRQRVTLRVQRKNCPGPVKLVVVGLPNGVEMASVQLAAEEDLAQAELRAEATALATHAAAVHIYGFSDRVKGPIGQFELTVVRPKPKNEKEITNSIGMKLALIPAGKFKMGSPDDEAERDKDDEYQHEVAITKPFHLGIHEVTQEQYERVMGTNPSWFSAAGEGKAKVAGLDTRRFPVEQVSWKDADDFCQKLSALPEEKRAGRTYRLPSEAEWEYACRGGSPDPGPFFLKQSSRSLSSLQTNFNGTFPYGGAPEGRYLERPVPVDEPGYEPNGFGLFHMHGNVWEWCQDWYEGGYYKSSRREDPPGPSQGSDRVIRGGSWFDFGLRCRAANRFRSTPTCRDYSLGFRVALVPSGGE